MRKRSGLTLSFFVCPKCGEGYSLPRFKSSQRERGHKKWLWCPRCKRKFNFTEVTDNNNYRAMDGTEYEQ